MTLEMFCHRKSIILVVDDNLVNIQLLSDFLDSQGFEIWTARDGESALIKASYEPPDLILLDIMMPGLNGFDTCLALKQNDKTKDIPVIFMSALSDPVDKVKGLSIGAVDYLEKPFQMSEVLARINLHLKLHFLNQTIEKQNQELEQRVKQRTDELSVALESLKKAQEKLQYDAFHDALTCLPNRSMLMQHLHYLIQSSSHNPDYLYAVFFLDLDRFKVVNDSLGHLIGDELLKSVAERLQNALNPEILVTRFGGDEFVILLSNLQDVGEVTAIAELILRLFKKPFKLNNYEVFTGVSIGITLSCMGYTQPEEVLRDADIAMYHAKISGKGGYQVLTGKIQQVALQRLQLENDIRQGLLRKEFCLYYQPIISLSDGCLAGFEALLRWEHPQRGWLSPYEFIPVAEETGLIHSLGSFVLEEACYQISIWNNLFSHFSSLSINVNFSPIQFKQTMIFVKLAELCYHYNLSGDSLKVEITETGLMEAIAWDEEILKSLKKLGIKLCIDDFGTGYSSLSRLHELPINTLKIDRSFVQQIGVSQGKTEIVKTIITLARNLGMDVVAEGVETLQQLKYIQNLGCEFAQGYLFSKPISSTVATNILRNNQSFF